MANLFVEDVIVKRLRGGKYQFGLVVTNYETYDSDDDSDHGGHPTEPDERINEGQIRVAWYPKGNEEIVDDTKVTLYDRSLMPGDVVYSRTKGSGTQCGFVRSVDILCHIRIFRTKQMIYDVNSRDLHQIMEFQHGDHVVLGFWLGTVRDVSSELVIKLQNGARYVVTDEGASKLTDVNDNSEEFSVFSNEDGYYPGQVLHGPASVFKKARWLSGTKPIMGSKTNFRGTVEKVKVTSVEVHWETRGLCIHESFNDDELFKPPDKNIEGDQLKELKVLQHFKAASVQIGDKSMYTVKTDEKILPQRVPLGSIECFKQPEPAQKAAGKKSRKEDSPEECPPEKDQQAEDPTKEDSHKRVLRDVQAESNHNKEDPQHIDPREEDLKKEDLRKRDPREEDPHVEDPKSDDPQEKNPQEDQQVEDLKKEDLRKRDQQEEDPQVEDPKIEDPKEEDPQENVEVDKVDALKISEALQELNAILKDTLDSDDTRRVLEQQAGDQKEVVSGISVIENNDEGKCAEASACTKENHTAKFDSINLDLGLIHDIHQQLLDASEGIAKIGGRCKPLIGGEAAEHMEQYIVKLLESRNELHEQIALLEGLLKGNELLATVTKKDSSRKPPDDHSNIGHQKNGTARVKSRPGRQKKRDVTAGEEVCVEVTHTSTVVDVTWQDGTTEKSIRSSQLCPLNQMDELEFFPGDFVSQSENIEEGMYGLITSANHQDRTCMVRWYRRPMQEELSIPHYTHTAESSVYDLMSHTDFTFSTGDIIVRVADSRQEGLEQLLPCAGQVLWMNTDGTVEVVWVDNTQSTALPQDLYKLDEDSDSDWSDNEDDDGRWHLDSHSIEGSESSWETASEGSNDSLADLVLPGDAATVDEQNERNVVDAIEGETTEIISEATETTRQQLNEQTSTTTDEPSKPAITEDSNQNIQPESANDAILDEVNLNIPVSEGVVTQGGKASADLQCSEDQEAGGEAISNPDNEQSNKFVSIESVPSSHIFAQCVHTATTPKRFISTVKKEISLLQCSLPVGILVKSFEDRMDLFSVLIEGPKNTPYEDALFHFDVRLPADYPGVPPLLHFHSYCSRRLNPNLYEDGKVCISLLGTWTGKHHEMWNSKSTLLQVLVSIQGLILVAEPYYNEAGFEKHRGSSLGEENSQMYNEMTLLKVVQSMTKMLLNPPIIFKDEVIDFCRKHNASLIERIERWLEAGGTPTSIKPGLADSVKPVPAATPGRAASIRPGCIKPGLPAFPLLPFSKGFLLSIRQALEAYRSALAQTLST